VRLVRAGPVAVKVCQKLGLVQVLYLVQRWLFGGDPRIDNIHATVESARERMALLATEGYLTIIHTGPTSNSRTKEAKEACVYITHSLPQ